LAGCKTSSSSSSRRSSMMTASKGLSPEVGRCLTGVVSKSVDPSATWATRPTTPGGMEKTTEWEVDVRLYRLYVLGVLSCSLAMWPKTAMRRCRMTSLMAGRPVSTNIWRRRCKLRLVLRPSPLPSSRTCTYFGRCPPRGLGRAALDSDDAECSSKLILQRMQEQCGVRCHSCSSRPMTEH